MRTALLHRRLSAGMGLAALAAMTAGAGLSPLLGLAMAALGVALFWQPSPEASVWVERVSRAGVLALCAWMLYVALVLVGDFMPAVMAMLLFLLVTESLRSLDARNDMRLYSLSFALLIASTAYYPGVVFSLAFVAYVVLATLGMMVGFLRRQAETLRVPEIRVGRPFLSATAALSVVTVLISVALFVLFPRLPRQWHVQGRARGGEVMAGFSDRVSLGEHGARIAANPETAFRVEFPAGAPAETGGLYWRGRSFDRFDGERWSRSPGLPLSDLSGRAYARQWGGTQRVQRIFGGPPGAQVLFGLHPVLDVDPRSAIRAHRDAAGDLFFTGTDEPVYTVASAAALPPLEALRAAPEGPAPVGGHYLQLPRLSARVARLADSLTAGRATRLDRVLAVRDHLAGFGYTLDLPATRREATLEHFLFERREGHCEYFATALTVLLRAEGIPARTVTGFLGGTWNGFGDYLAVTGNDAHAWTEVWFPGLGWVPFDATPAGSRLEALRLDAGAGWAFPAIRWLDGLEHRWYKWVLDYNLDRQLRLFADVGSLFSRNTVGQGGERMGRPSAEGALPWAAGAVGAVALWALLRGRRRRPLLPQARAYLALRRAYARAGWAPAGGETPLAWAAALRREGAPGAERAARVVDLYLRARFSGGPAAEAEQAAVLREAAAARAALRGHARAPGGPLLARLSGAPPEERVGRTPPGQPDGTGARWSRSDTRWS